VAGAVNAFYLRYSDKKQDGNNSLAIQKSPIQQLAESEN